MVVAFVDRSMKERATPGSGRRVFERAARLGWATVTCLTAACATSRAPGASKPPDDAAAAQHGAEVVRIPEKSQGLESEEVQLEYFMAKRFDELIGFYEAALDEGGSDPITYLNRLAVAYLGRGDAEKAYDIMSSYGVLEEQSEAAINWTAIDYYIYGYLASKFVDEGLDEALLRKIFHYRSDIDKKLKDTSDMLWLFCLRADAVRRFCILSAYYLSKPEDAEKIGNEIERCRDGPGSYAREHASEIPEVIFILKALSHSVELKLIEMTSAHGLSQCYFGNLWEWVRPSR